MHTERLLDRNGNSCRIRFFMVAYLKRKAGFSAIHEHHYELGVKTRRSMEKTKSFSLVFFYLSGDECSS